PLAGTLFPNAASTPFVPGSATVRASGGINMLDLPGGPGCGSINGMGPYDERLWNSPPAALACAWDTGRAAVLQQPIDTLTFVARGAFKLGGGHVVTAEATGSKADSAKRFSNLQLTPNTTTQQLRFPRNAESAAAYDSVFNRLVATFPTLEPQRGQPISYRWRCIECGPREITTTTETRRLFAGIDGPLFGWDYRAGIARATSESQSTLGGGYYFRGTNGTGGSDGGPGIIPALNSGRINIFLSPGQTQSAAGLAALEEGSARGTVLYGGEFTLTQLDFTTSGSVFKLPAGDVMAAVGVDLRREEYRFNGDEREVANRRVIIAAPFDDGNALLGTAERDVKAVFGEVLIPIVKDLETTLSVRRDEYDGFGGTTNPKVSLRFKALDSLLLRASYSTGFRVPTFNQLYNGISAAEYTGADVAYPRSCPGGRVDTSLPGCGAIRPIIINGGKVDLGPEEAKMAGAGFIFEPTPNISIGIDWWSIKREGTIQLLTLRTLLENVTLFPERFGTTSDGVLVIDQRWLNAGETETEGVEVSLKGGFNALGARWTAGLEGTYLIKKRSRVVASAPFGASEVGQFSFAGDLGLRWKHSANLTYKRGDWSSSFSQLYKSGYNDQVLPGVASGRVSPPDFKSKVDDYITYNLSATYTGFKGLTVTGLVKNLFDKDPPYAATYDSNFGSGSSWEPRVADPRGRAFVLNVEYRFF
ncbi:MAG: TonB-dependent receptor, partial [Chitinophagaceae bacterium]|nr:TonB-dependent receptor [Rubrivivax sp.]